MSTSTLNTLSTIVGLIGAGSTLLGNAGIINHGLAGTISGLAVGILGYLTHQPAAGEQSQPQK